MMSKRQLAMRWHQLTPVAAAAAAASAAEVRIFHTSRSSAFSL